MEHFSWKESKFNFGDLDEFQKQCSKQCSKYATEYQQNLIPVFDAGKINFAEPAVQEDIYIE